jgi:hypothetical protein
MIDPDTIGPLVVASRTLVALVFLSAALGKLKDRAAFHGAVHAYRLLPDGLVGPVALFVPLAEIVIGLLLPSGLAPGVAAVAASAMLAVFTGAMALNMLRGRRDIDCGCFHGRPSRRLTWGAIARTAALAVAAVLSGVPASAPGLAAVQGLAGGAILFILFATAAILPTFDRQRPRISL